MRARISSTLFVLFTIVSASALAQQSAAPKVKRPAMAVKAANKGDAAWARTIHSSGDNHVVAWKSKTTGDINLTTVNAGQVGTTTPFTPPAGGKVHDMTRSRKSVIVEMPTQAGPTYYQTVRLAGKRAGQTNLYAPRKYVEGRANGITNDRTTGSQQGDWLKAEQELKRPALP